MNTPDQNDELRRRSEEGWAFKEKRDTFFRCGGYAGMPDVKAKAEAKERSMFEAHADLEASLEFGDKKDAMIL
jgi:hypothetical protein